jgi:hypothetical protein
VVVSQVGLGILPLLWAARRPRARPRAPRPTPARAGPAPPFPRARAAHVVLRRHEEEGLEGVERAARDAAAVLPEGVLARALGQLVDEDRLPGGGGSGWAE